MRCGERVRLDSRFAAWLAWKRRRCGGVFTPDPEPAGLGSTIMHPAGQPTGVDNEHLRSSSPVREDRVPACQPVWRTRITHAPSVSPLRRSRTAWSIRIGWAAPTAHAFRSPGRQGRAPGGKSRSSRTARSCSEYTRCYRSSLRTIGKHSRTGKVSPTSGHPGPTRGSTCTGGDGDDAASAETETEPPAAWCGRRNPRKPRTDKPRRSHRQRSGAQIFMGH
jgi:hypothetical protein